MVKLRRSKPARNATELRFMANLLFYSGGGLSFSGSFFLPPKIPKIFAKGLFFFSAVVAVETPDWEAAGPPTSLEVMGVPSAVVCGALGWPPPKMWDSQLPEVPAVLWPPWRSQNSVGAEPAT